MAGCDSMCGASDWKDVVGFPLEQEKERVYQKESGSSAPALHKRGLKFPFCSFYFDFYVLPAFLIAPRMAGVSGRMGCARRLRRDIASMGLSRTRGKMIQEIAHHVHA